jgi:hypothetical protein
MANPRKCANATCTCLAPEKKKYCSDHCEGIGNKIEILCLCSHANCGVTAFQTSAMPEFDQRSEVNSPGGPAARP